MYHLALETSTRTGSICLFDQHQPLECLVLPDELTTTASLITGLRELLNSLDLTPSEIGLVSVSTGPGSFTGLRIGATVAKTWAYAVDCPVAAIDTHQIIAHQAWSGLSDSQRLFSRTIATAINAQRNEWFVAIHGFDQQPPLVLKTSQIIDPGDFFADQPAPVWLSGPGLTRSGLNLARHPRHVRVTDEKHWQPTARTAGILGFRAFQENRTIDHWSLVPKYGRRSAAEEKLDARVK